MARFRNVSNNGNGTFSNATSAYGVDDIWAYAGQMRSCGPPWRVMGDFDNDGDQDFAHLVGGVSETQRSRIKADTSAKSLPRINFKHRLRRWTLTRLV